ncbi:MAG: threonine/serine dehydratase [Woeseiaceae bacterium]|nr:threonine/serine dehydratase [Woeseiaceae bacterium]
MSVDTDRKEHDIAIDSTQVAAAAHDAAERIASLVRETPLDYSPSYSARTGANVYFKLENLQHTSSFKLRGAANRLMTLTPEQRAVGGVAASSGNHGAAVAYAMQKLGVPGMIFVPEQTTATKVDAIRAYGGDVRFFGTDGLDTELHARGYAEENGMAYLSPYNDQEVVAGQGTCGVEIAGQLPDVDAVFVAVGGGGLIGGVGSVLKEHRADIEIVGCQPANSPVMARSIEAGEIVDMPSEPTLSDGTAGGIEAGAITFDLCRAVTNRFVVVDEAGIAASMRTYMDAEHQLIEGAAGVAIAAFERLAGEFAGKNVVILVCGGNISREMLKTVIC